MSIPIRSSLDLGLNQLIAALVENLSADPGTVTNGRVFYHTGTNTFKVGVGGSYVSFLVSTTRLDQLQSPTGPVALNSQKITGLADPTNAQEAATKAYVDAVINGMDIKASVRVTSATTVTVSAPGATIDGITMVAGDRVLLKSQTAASENGIYIWNGSAVAMTRAADMDAWAEVPGAIVAVEVGTVNADTVWLSTADQGGTLGTTGITWTKIAPVTAGGGTVTKFSSDITGDATTTAFNVTHNLGSTDVHVQVWEASTNALVLTDVVRTNGNQISVNFAQAPASAKVYRVVVMA